MTQSQSNMNVHYPAVGSAYLNADDNSTQRFSTQEYQNKLDSRRISLSCEVLREQPVGEVDTEPRTYHTGEDGHVDLQEESDKDDSLSTSEDELLSTSPSQSQSHAGISSAGRPPTTPAVAGTKRDRDDNAITPASRTPAVDLTTFFKSGEAHVVGQGLSQLFNQTQAPSSPPPVGIMRSDPISERPSPDFRHLRYSSPPGGISSPATKQSVVFTRNMSDPREKYVSMKQSQEMRESKRSKAQTADETVDEDELEIDWEVRKMLHKRTVNQIQQDVRRRFANLNTPVSKLRNADSERRISVSGANVSNIQPLLRGFEPIPVSDDTPAKAQDDYLSDRESFDEYDELSQAVISSDRRDGLDDEAVDAPETHESNPGSPKSRLLHNSTKSYPSRNLPNSVENGEIFEPSGDGRSSSQPLPGGSTSARLQSIFIADSQQYSMEPCVDEMPGYPTIPSSIGLQRLGKTSQQTQDAEMSKSRTDQVLAGDLAQTSSIPSAPVQSSAENLRDMSGQNRDLNWIVQETSAVPLRTAASIADETPNPAVFQELRKGERDQANQALDAANLQVSLSKKLDEMVPETSPATAAKPQRDKVTLPQLEAVSTREASDFKGTKSFSPSNKTTESGSRIEHLYHSARSERSRSSKPATPKSPLMATPWRAEFKKLTEISALAEPSDQSESLDYSSIKIMNEEDYQYAKTVSGASPAIRSPKRRKVKRHNSAIFGSPEQSKSELSPVHERETSNVHINRPSSAPKMLADISEKDVNKHQILNSQRYVEAQNDSASAAMVVKLHSSKNLGPTLDDKGLLDERESHVGRSRSDSPVSTLSRERTPTPPSQLRPPELIACTKSEVDQHFKAALSRRVFARFRGSNNAYYTATVLAPAGTIHAPAMKVRFDDGSEDEVSSFRISRLELREDDEVKVDMPGLRNNTYIIKALTCRVTSDIRDVSQHLETDVQGFRKVQLCLKGRSHTSTSERGSGQMTSFETAVSNLYIPSNRWSNYADRVFDASALLVQDEARLLTPTLAPSPPTTPSSRTRGQRVSNMVPPVPGMLLKTSMKQGIFANMMFAVTFMDSKDSSRARVIQSIEENGGQILTNGFYDLFDLAINRPDEPSVSSSSGSEEDSAFDEQTLSQSIKTSAAKLGFTALIADGHSRKAKHMQALALNLPCLSYLWIMDSVAQERIVPWQKYLLSAGESTYLRAIKSQTICLRDARDVSLPSFRDLLSARPRLLDGLSIIAITGRGKAKATRQAYTFLILALGAQRIHQVSDLAAAKKFLSKENAYKWHWVYVDDASRTAAKKSLSMMQIQHRPRVVRDEYVIQSLIMGMLLNPEAFSVGL